MLVGLTGGIGCGKSTVLKYFSRLNWKTLDADTICHTLYEKKTEMFSAIHKRWGKRIIRKDGTVNRKKVSEIVFNDKDELIWLNSLLHPKVLETAKKAALESKEDVIFDVPLLFEADWKNEFDATIAVWTSKKIQRKRLLKRGWSSAEINRRINSQMPAEEKLEKADFGLVNNSSHSLLFEQCEKLSRQLKDCYEKEKK